MERRHLKVAHFAAFNSFALISAETAKLAGLQMRAFLIFAFLMTFQALVPATSWGSACNSAHRLTLPSGQDTGVYFVMPAKVGSGTLEDTRRLLPNLKAGGVKNIWLGPVHPQTKMEYGIHGKNDHGYWPADHSKVGLGGEAAFRQLTQEAKNSGIGIWIDAVVGHFGYGESVRVNGKVLSLEDSTCFHSCKAGTPLVDPKMLELSGKLDRSEDFNEILTLQKEIAQIPIYHLPKIRHDNPKMAQYLIDSYSKFLDMGVTGFRIDAAKHIDLDFLKRFVRELQEMGLKKHGFAPEFLFEFTISSSRTLDFFINYIRTEAKDPSKVYAIDFPMAYEARRLEDPDYRLDWFVGFLNYRWQNKQKIQNLIPFVENHDFETPLNHPFNVKLSYMMTDFFSGQSPIISHGLENSMRKDKNNRPIINRVHPHADLFEARKALSNALGSVRRNAEGDHFKIILANHDFIMAERKIDAGRTLLLLANKSLHKTEVAPLFGSFKAQHKILYRTFGVNLVPLLADSVDSSVVRVELSPSSFVLIEKKGGTSNE